MLKKFQKISLVFILIAILIEVQEYLGYKAGIFSSSFSWNDILHHEVFALMFLVIALTILYVKTQRKF